MANLAIYRIVDLDGKEVDRGNNRELAKRWHAGESTLRNAYVHGFIFRKQYRVVYEGEVNREEYLKPQRESDRTRFIRYARKHLDEYGKTNANKDKKKYFDELRTYYPNLIIRKLYDVEGKRKRSKKGEVWYVLERGE